MPSSECPKCRERSIVNTVRDFAGTKIRGTECTSCGWKRTDGRAHRYDVECYDCKRKVGYVYTHETLKLHGYVCSDCSIKHLRTNNPRPLKTRWEILCIGTCGKVVAWKDHYEGQSPDLPRLKCMKCG